MCAYTHTSTRCLSLNIRMQIVDHVQCFLQDGTPRSLSTSNAMADIFRPSHLSCHRAPDPRGFGGLFGMSQVYTNLLMMEGEHNNSPALFVVSL